MTQTKYRPSGLIEVQEGTKIEIPSSGFVLPVGKPFSFLALQNVNGPTNALSFSGSYIAGIVFTCSQAGCFLAGYYWWVCPGSPAGPTAPQKCALWSVTSASSTGVVIPSATVTSGPLHTGWNLIPLATPIPLALGGTYIACTGVNGNFPDTTDQFGPGDPFEEGIQNGPIFAFADFSVEDGAYPNGHESIYTTQQGVFTTGGSDPSVTLPNQGSSQSNLWMDVLVLDGPPAGYTGTFRFWPNVADATGAQNDVANNFVLSTEMAFVTTVKLKKIWWYSPAGVTQLPTSVDIWKIPGGANVFTAVPTWSGAAGSGWVSTTISGSLPAGKYYVSVYNGAATPASFSSRTSGYFAPLGFGQNGMLTGPISAPNTANASPAYLYTPGGAGNDPPFSDGSGNKIVGQSVFAVGPPNQFPYLYVTPTPVTAECFFCDLEVSL